MNLKKSTSKSKNGMMAIGLVMWKYIARGMY